MRKGLTEQEVTQAVGDLSVADQLDQRQLAALRLADTLTEYGAPSVDAKQLAELTEVFDPGEILELGSALSVASGWQRFIEAFGIRPDHWSEATPKPQRPEDHSEISETARSSQRDPA